MASAAYELSLKKFMDADIDILVDTIKARIVRQSAYTFSQAHNFMDDAPAAIVADVTLGSKTTTAGVFDAADAVFAVFPAGAAVDAVIIHKFVTNDADSIPFLYLEFTGVVPNGGDISLVWAAASPNIWKLSP